MNENEVIELLKQYSTCKRFIDSQAYAKEYFNPHDTQQIDEKALYEARMHAIESLIQMLSPSDECTLLHLHYIKGLSVEKSAETMNVSRRTAYRTLKKAHGRICEMFFQNAADVAPKSEVAREIFESLYRKLDYYKRYREVNDIINNFFIFIEEVEKEYTEGET